MVRWNVIGLWLALACAASAQPVVGPLAELERLARDGGTAASPTLRSRLLALGRARPAALVEALRRYLPSPGSPAVRSLIEQLGARSYSRRSAAERALRELGPGIRPALEGARDHEDLEIRRRVRALLRGIAAAPRQPESAQPHLRLLLGVLAELPVPTAELRPTLLRASRADDREVRALALRCLARRPPDEATITRMVAGLGDDRPVVREAATLALVRVGPRIRPYLQRIRGHVLFGHPPERVGTDLRIRWQTLRFAADPEDAAALAALRTLLAGQGSGDMVHPALALLASRRIGLGAPTAGALLFLSREGTPVAVRPLAAAVLAQTPHDPALGRAIYAGAAERSILSSRRMMLMALPSVDMAGLIAALGMPDHHIRLVALRVVAHLGADARPALASVRRMMRSDPKDWLRAEAVKTLAAIGGGAPTVDELVATLADGAPNPRIRALYELGKLGRAARSALPALIRFVEGDAPGHIRYQAVYAAARIDVRDPRVVALLARRLTDKEASVRHAAGSMLLYAGPAARPHLATLLAMTRSPDPGPQYVGAHAGLLAPSDPRVVSALTRLLAYATHARVLQMTAQVLGKAGSAGRPALAALRGALGRAPAADPALRAAIEAIGAAPPKPR